MKASNHLRTHAVNAKSDQLVGIGNLQAFRAQSLDERRVHTKDAKCNQLVGVEPAEMLVLHLLREFERDVHNRHAELLIVISVIVFIATIDNRKTERLHLAGIVRVRLKMKESRAFAVAEKSLAIDLARIAHDGEVHVLTTSLRKVHALKRTRGPSGLVIGIPAVMMLDHREHDLARIFGFAERPIATADCAANFRGAILDHKQKHAARENKVSQRSTHSHKIISSR